MSRLRDFLFQPGSEMARLRNAVTGLIKTIPSVDNLLDVGCADGKVSLEYATLWNLPREKVFGIEAQPKYLTPPLPFAIASVNIETAPLPYASEFFDLVICNQVLEHLKIVIHPLREIVRVTKTGGHILIGVPNLASLMARLQLLFGREPISLNFPGPHIRGFTHRGMRTFLQMNPNLRLKGVTGSSLYPFPPPLTESGARVFPGLACYTLYLLEKTRHTPALDWPAAAFPDESLTG